MRVKKRKNKNNFYLLSLILFISFLSYYLFIFKDFLKERLNDNTTENNIIEIKETRVLDYLEKETILPKKISNDIEKVEEKSEEFLFVKEELQKYLIKEIMKNWREPFNYKESDFCIIEYNFKNNSIKIKECSGNVLKRSVQLSLDKNKIILKNNYNNVDLSKEILYFNFFKNNEVK